MMRKLPRVHPSKISKKIHTFDFVTPKLADKKVCPQIVKCQYLVRRMVKLKATARLDNVNAET